MYIVPEGVQHLHGAISVAKFPCAITGLCRQRGQDLEARVPGRLPPCQVQAPRSAVRGGLRPHEPEERADRKGSRDSRALQVEAAGQAHRRARPHLLHQGAGRFPRHDHPRPPSAAEGPVHRGERPSHRQGRRSHAGAHPQGC